LLGVYFVTNGTQPPTGGQLSTQIAHIVKAPLANATTKAFSKSAILPTRLETPINSFIFRFFRLYFND